MNWQAAALVGGVGVVGGVAVYRTYCYYHTGYQRVFSVEEGDVVLDVGAATGLFTIPAARKASLVIAVEPESRNVATLRRRTASMPNVHIIDKAAWNREGVLPLYLSGWLQHSLLKGQQPYILSKITMGHSPLKGGRTRVMTQVDTLDNMVSGLGIPRIDFMKMDIEGAELEALEGAESILSTARKVVIAAYHKRPDIRAGPTHPWVSEFLRSRGFETHLAWPGLVHAWRESL